MKATNNLNDFFDHPFLKAERVEINIRPTFLPLFFKQSEIAKNKEIEKPHVIERILENVEIIDGKYMRDFLTNMKFDMEGEFDMDFYTKGKFKTATLQFARQIFDTYYDPVFETLQPVEELQDGREVYDQFKGNPTKAAHFLVHKFYETGKIPNVVCKDVAQIPVPGKNIQVDFTFGEFYNEKYGFQMRRNHLYYFRIFKKYAKKGYNTIRLRGLYMSDMLEAKDVEIDFDYCLQIMKDTCLKGELWDKYNNRLVYGDDCYSETGRRVNGTGWKCGFIERENQKILELLFLYNNYIDGEFIDLIFDYNYKEVIINLKDYPKYLADMEKVNKLSEVVDENTFKLRMSADFVLKNLKQIILTLLPFQEVAKPDCEDDDEDDCEEEKHQEFDFSVVSKSDMYIDWGDGTYNVEHFPPPGDEDVDILENIKFNYQRRYDGNSIRTIVITGENITYFSSYSDLVSGLDVSSNTALTELHLYNMKLDALDVSKNSALEVLSVSVQLKELDVSKNTVLKKLECTHCRLTNLDVSKNSELTELNCGENQLTELDVRKNTLLSKLFCYYNQLTELDVRKNKALTDLGCGANKLSSLDVSKNIMLKLLWCATNQLTSLNVSKNKKLVSLNCLWNNLKSLDVSENTELEELRYDKNVNVRKIKPEQELMQIEATETKQMTLTVQNTDKVVLRIAGVAGMTIDWGDVTEETFALSAYEDHRGWRETKKLKYKYSHTYPDKSIRTISITGKKMTHLRCFQNQMTGLDVSKNTVLEHLDCEANQMTNLDVSKNTVLKYLHCFKNQLTSLDVSNNTHLEQLWCGKNQLTGLDMSKNTLLKSLGCDDNKLASLDVSKNYRLSLLYCSINQLTCLDVSNNKDLKNLFCFENQLSNLDVSKNSKLIRLSCGGNQLTKLDLNKNEALRYLECIGNQLTCFDLSENRRIEEFLYFKPSDLEIIQQHFHALMIERAKEGGVTLKTDHLPKITNETFIKTYNGPNSQGISGMYSGFTYQLTERNGKPMLATESWGKVEYGSGQRHEITVEGYVLVALLELEKMKKRPKTHEDMVELIRTHKDVSNDTKCLMEGIEKIEFDVRPFMPLFFGKDRNKQKKADKAEETARFFLQDHIQTGGREKMVCEHVMKVNLGGKQIDVDLAFGKEGEGISLPQNRHLNDFLLYQTFAGRKNLTELTRNDGIRALCASLNFSSVMDWMTETSNNPTPPFPIKEYISDPAKKGEFRITFYNHNTGWQCTFQGKDGSNTLTVSNFYNSSIPECAKEVYSMEWYKMAHPVRKAASSLVKELRHGQTDKTVRDYFTGRLRSGDEGESILFEEVVGNLHDSLEDSQYSVEQVMQMFQERCDGQLFDEYAATIQEALNLLNSNTAASREEYIARLCQSENKVALSVMMIDHKQNMDISRIENPTEKDFERVELYKKEYEQILAVHGKDIKSV